MGSIKQINWWIGVILREKGARNWVGKWDFVVCDSGMPKTKWNQTLII